MGVGMTDPRGTIEQCALCGKDALGFAMVGDKRLCHDEKRACYERWIAYGQRPGDKNVAEVVGAEKYSLRPK